MSSHIANGVRAMNSNLPQVILYLAVVLIVIGIALHGIGFTEIQRVLDDLIARPGGSLSLRFILQPVMSTIFALRDGIKDARTGRSPYFWTVLSNPDQRRARLREGLGSTGKIILIAVLLDGIYQVIELKTIYPIEALIVAILLAFIPYLLLRGPIERVARWWFARKSDGAAS
jgi:hypothetical protein